MSKYRQWHIVVDGKGMRMISEFAITLQQAIQDAHQRFGEARVTAVQPAMPSDIKSYGGAAK